MDTINKKILLIAGLILAAFLTMASHSFAWSGKCVGVADGDTITVMHNGKSERIRLHGIDCPESGQDFGKRAKQYTSGMVFGKTVTIEKTDTDGYGRTVAMVYAGGKCVNEDLIRAGFAWVFTKYCKENFCTSWKSLENEARFAGTGLWAHGSPISPWEYRYKGKGPDGSGDTMNDAGGVYHGNSKSHVFHRPGCRHYNCKNCTVVFQGRDAAIKAKYRACGMCKP
jgi:endonuclease YncB( thermonuclease family)